MSGFTEDTINTLFTYHPPFDEKQIERYRRIREAGRQFASVILKETPGSAEQTLAIRAAHQAVMHANTAIALSDPLTPPS